MKPISYAPTACEYDTGSKRRNNANASKPVRGSFECDLGPCF